MTRAVGVLLAVFFVAQLTPRDVASRPAAATGAIRGRVVIADSDIPVRKARISLTPENGAPHEPVYTNAEGLFELTDVAPGRYVVAAWKSGMVEAKFGARNFWDRHVSIVVTAGGAVDGLQLMLTKGAAISGRVMDDDGEPMVGAEVAVGRLIVANGRPRLEIVSGRVETDDLGEYRVGGLPAGSYVVSVFGWPPSPARSARPAGAGPVGMPDAMQRPHTVFYPRTVSLLQATPIVVHTGEEVNAADVTFVSTGSSARVSGRVIDPQSRSTGFSISASSDGGGDPATAMGVTMSVPQSSEFSIPLGPGEYAIVAQGETGSATQRVVVGRDDISGLQLVLAGTSRVSGRVVFEGAATRPAGRLVVEAWSPDFRPGMMPMRIGAERDGQPALVAANGAFELTGVFGERELRVNQLPQGWYVKSIVAGGRDLLDVPIAFKPGEDLRNVVITLSDRAAGLAGIVTDARGTPVSAASVLIFPEDPRQIPGRARWVKPDHLGRFVASGLPAGSYLVALADQVDDLRWSSAEYLDPFRATATRVMLAHAESRTVALQWSDPR